MTIPEQIVKGNYKYITHPSQLVQGMVCEIIDDYGKWQVIKWDWWEWLCDGAANDNNPYYTINDCIEKQELRQALLTEEQLAGIEGVEKKAYPDKQEGYYHTYRHYRLSYDDDIHILTVVDIKHQHHLSFKNLTETETITILNALA